MGLIEFLEYRTFAYNRAKYPNRKAKEYRFLYKNWKEYEEKYQSEKEKWDWKLEHEDEIKEKIDELNQVL